MKSRTVSLTLSLAVVALLSLAGCAERGADRSQARAAFNKIESGTGEALEGAGDAVGAGVDKVDETWETPQEQRMERRMDNLEEQNNQDDMDRNR